MISVVEDSDGIAITAGIVMQLDLVITVDTMIAHLAGALNRPVWTLHKLAADWRWMTGRDDSPWYPSMRLFRQTRFGDWDDVIRRVYAALCTRAANGWQCRNSFQDPSDCSDMKFSGRKESIAAPARCRESNLKKG